MKKALLVSINRYPTAPLRGCLNDSEDWHSLLRTQGKYPPDNIRTVCDERATDQGIRERMEWLKEGISGPGDEVFFAFSGHGSQVRDRGVKDELSDGLDEVICPVDLDWQQKIIVDDDIGEWLEGFPTGTRIIVVLDCCHSGTATRSTFQNPHYIANRYIHPPLDLALRAEGLPRRKGINITTRIGRGVRKKNCASKVNGSEKPGCWPWRSKPSLPESKPPACQNHVLISGSRSDQTSAEAFINSRYNGVLSRHLIDAIRLMGTKSIAEIHGVARKTILDAGFTQESQLEGPDSLIKGPLFV